MFTRFDTIHERDGHRTDGQTDTAGQRTPRLWIASPGKTD